MKKCIIVIFCLLIIPVFTFAEEDYSKYPGYVDLSGLTGVDVPETSVEVYLKEPLLKLLAATTSDDPELVEMLKGLLMIQVRQYSTEDKSKKGFQKFISSYSKKLEAKKWDRIVKAKEEGEHVEIFIMISDDKIQGLFIMALEPSESVFVNIVGELDLELLGELGAKFDIPNLDDIDLKDEEN